MNGYTLLVPSRIDQIQPICFYQINYSIELVAFQNTFTLTLTHRML